MSVTMPLLSIEDLAVAVYFPTGWSLLRMTHRYMNKVETGPGCLEGESGALN